MKVLIADDDPVSQRLLERYLRKWDYEVTVTADGAKAWEKIQNEEFPIVICDWMMPNLDGPELIRRIRADNKGGYVYTILLTSRSQKGDFVEGMESGADEFVRKPFDHDELHARLRAGERIVNLERSLRTVEAGLMPDSGVVSLQQVPTITTQSPPASLGDSPKNLEDSTVTTPVRAGQSEITDTRQKALRINLDLERYGAFAEIGAGQEVVRWFFRVGGAAGTIARSISAYDMVFSDAIYGTCERYVCRPRLQSMLDYEYESNLSQLRHLRGDTTAFFAFADTVSARNYKGTNECHGWMGVKFQAVPRDVESQVIIHVRMIDTDNALQQEALGVVGVNLMYAAFYLQHDPDRFIESLLDSLSVDRIEIDMIEFSGIAFHQIDNRVMSMKLVQLGLSDAAMFAANGAVLQPSEVLYKKPILVERGSFRPVTNVHVDMLRCAHEKFAAEPGVEADKVVQLMEITMSNLLVGGQVDYRDFLARADLLAATGVTVLISDYFEYYRLAAYLARYTQAHIGITMGIPSLRELFNNKYYTQLQGGILESFGRLFKNDLKLYIYPLLDTKTGDFTAVQNLEIADDLRKLYEYLVEQGRIEQLNNFNESCLPINSRDVLSKIEQGDPAWEEMVPAEVAEVIKQRAFFGFHE